MKMAAASVFEAQKIKKVEKETTPRRVNYGSRHKPEP